MKTNEEQPALRWLRRGRLSLHRGSRSDGEASAPPAKRLGVLSATFNPPTLAHLALAEASVQQLALDEVLFVIPEVPPHKEQLAAALDARAEMLLLALEPHPEFSAAISTHGLIVDIYRALVPHYSSGTKVFFLMGRDAAERILIHWPYGDVERALAQMFACFDVAVAERRMPGHAAQEFKLPPGVPAAKYRRQIHAVQLPEALAGISATQARERLARGEPIESQVPVQVANYIRTKGLYMYSNQNAQKS